MIPASLFLGFTASILWCAEVSTDRSFNAKLSVMILILMKDCSNERTWQGTYLTHAAKCHATACDISEEAAIGSFFGQFWAVFASNQVFCKTFIQSDVRAHE